MCFSFYEEKQESQLKCSSNRDGFHQKSRADAGVVRAGPARARLRDCRAARALVSSPARQAEKTPGVPSRSVPHPNNREHHVSGHRAARLPQEAE